MKFKKNATIETSDFWYDLLDGGYIKPEELLEEAIDISIVEEAIAILLEFYESAEEQEIIEFN